MTLVFHFHVTDAELDPDNDTFTNYEEYLDNGDPYDPLFPCKATNDNDNDGLDDCREQQLGTNWIDDGDDETTTDIDTDQDGLTDGAEVNTYQTDPKVKDTDGDGLEDGEETGRDVTPVNTGTGTNPTREDTDEDGLFDGEEVNGMTVTIDTGKLIQNARREIITVTYKSNPLTIDTDGDGLNDYVEVRVYGTDPSDIDTDGDGVEDLIEIQIMTLPLDEHSFSPF